MSLKIVQFQYLSAKEFISEFSKGQQFQNIGLSYEGYKHNLSKEYILDYPETF